ncbi:MAG: NusG domain II-containing protein [Firmicutes bacterium]|nr:NusG domain II-containing protein [Bacillota bacterium]
MFKFIKKADIVLFFVLLAFGIGLSALSLFTGTSGQKVQIEVNGQPYAVYSLAENQTIEITEHGHTNKITIKDGAVQMSYSDCKNQICVNDGQISKTNQSIVCLPNKVMVEITGGEEEFDAISN